MVALASGKLMDFSPPQQIMKSLHFLLFGEQLGPLISLSPFNWSPNYPLWLKPLPVCTPKTWLSFVSASQSHKFRSLATEAMLVSCILSVDISPSPAMIVSILITVEKMQREAWGRLLVGLHKEERDRNCIPRAFTWEFKGRKGSHHLCTSLIWKWLSTPGIKKIWGHHKATLQEWESGRQDQWNIFQ